MMSVEKPIAPPPSAVTGGTFSTVMSKINWSALTSSSASKVLFSLILAHSWRGPMEVAVLTGVNAPRFVSPSSGSMSMETA
jgi:hypothetical protein